MKLKLSPNLGIGYAELLLFQQSLEKVEVLDQFIESYGVVKKTSAFNEMKVIAGTGNTITILSGTAIDKDFNLIKIPQLDNQLVIPEDSTIRYVVIKYLESSIESESVQLQSDGTMTTTNTSANFTKKLRGIGPFPSKIKFPNSVNNVSEYFIRTVVDDQTVLLNVGSGIIIPESDQAYQIVGSFSPGVEVSDTEKFPFIRDSYLIELRTSNTVVQGKEFILAQVNYNNGAMTITDSRSGYSFLLNRYIIPS